MYSYPSASESSIPSASWKWFAGAQSCPPEKAVTPPTVGPFSITIESSPQAEAAIAPARPPIPAPIARKSVSSSQCSGATRVDAPMAPLHRQNEYIISYSGFRVFVAYGWGRRSQQGRSRPSRTYNHPSGRYGGKTVRCLRWSGIAEEPSLKQPRHQVNE